MLTFLSMRMIVLAIALLISTPLSGRDLSATGVYQSEVGIYVLTVALLPNGNYLARWDADIGTNGSAAGSWEASGEEIHLTPKKEEGHPMTGYLRVLLLREKDGRKALLRKEDASNQDNPFFYLYLRRASPNSPQPTPPKGG